MPRWTGDSSRTSFQTASASASPQSVPRRFAISKMIHRSSLASPGGTSAACTRWTRRSLLVTVPSVSAQAAAAGRTTSAISPVAVRKMSWTTSRSRPRRRPLRPVPVGLRLQGVLADHVERRELAAVHGVEHPRQVPAALGRDAHAPQVVAPLARLVVLDVLEPDQPVRERAHVAAALDVVLAAQRVDAAAVAADVPGQQGERDQREHVVDRVVVLGDAEGPADHRPLGLGVGVGRLADRRRGDARLALRVLERVRLDGLAIRVEARRRPPDELVVREARVDDLAGHRVGEGDVRADVEAQPQVRPLRAGRPSRVDRDQPRTPMDPLQEVVEEDRMRLPGVAAPQEEEIRLLGLTI